MGSDELINMYISEILQSISCEEPIQDTMPFQRGYGGGGAGGNYGGNRGYSSSGSGSGVSPWQMGQGQPGPGTKVDPLALMGSIMGAMMGGGGGNVQQLAGLAMANAIGPDRGYNDRDRRERQVMRVIRVC